MNKFILGLCLGIAITILSYNFIPYLYSQINSNDIRNITRELHSISRALENINNNLKK